MKQTQPPGEISREEVAARLRCSVATVQRFESEGRLTPRREQRGLRILVWFKLSQVEKLSREWQPVRAQRAKADAKIASLNIRGKVAAIALPMFEQYRDQCSVNLGSALLAAVCAAAEADPLLVQQLYEAWKLGLEGALAEKKRREDEEEDRRRQRAHDAETRQKRWIEGQKNVARELTEQARLQLAKAKAEAEAKEKTG